MKAAIGHLQINVSSKKSLEFYKDLLPFLGFKKAAGGDWGVGYYSGKSSFWVMLVDKKYMKKSFHRKDVGLNHIAFLVSSKKAVDDFYNKFLKVKKIQTLYQSPKKFPEYTKKYYAVFFEDPDRIKLEVVYH